MPQPQDGEKFCGARINYRTKEPATCCADRSDDCTFIMSDGVSSTSGLTPTISGLLPVKTDCFTDYGQNLLRSDCKTDCITDCNVRLYWKMCAFIGKPVIGYALVKTLQIFVTNYGKGNTLF